MTGTGTQNDPYIVDTWSDFVTAIGTSGVYVKVADDTAWDMNEIVPEGLSSTLDIRCKELDGNGLVIKNLHSKVRTFITVTYRAKDFSIRDFYHENFESSMIGVNTTANTVLERAAFSGVVAGNHSYRPIVFSQSDAQIRYCSMNAKVNIGTNVVFFQSDYAEGGTKREFNHIRLDLTNAKVHNNNFPIAYNNSLIEILRNSTDTGRYYKQAKNTIIRYDANTNREVNEVYNGNGTCTEVTSEQLQDAAYLASIGFPIGVD